MRLVFFVGGRSSNSESPKSKRGDSGAELVVAVVSSCEIRSGGEMGLSFFPVADGRWKKLSRLSWTFRRLAWLSIEDNGFRGRGTTISISCQQRQYFPPRI